MAKGYRHSRFTADVRGVGAMMTSNRMKSAMSEYIAAIEPEAFRRSPSSDEDYPGKYINSFETRAGVQQNRPKFGHFNRRAFAELRNTSPHAFFVEYGINGIRRSRVLRNALDTLGPAHSGVVVEKWDH